MTVRQREIHFFTWVALSVLLPMGWLAAIIALPRPVVQEPVRQAAEEPLPIIVHSAQAGDFIVNLRRDISDNRRQIEIFIQKPLTAPNVSVRLKTNPDSEILLGALGTRGFYRFDLDSTTARVPAFDLVFTDEIRRRQLRALHFQSE